MKTQNAKYRVSNINVTSCWERMKNVDSNNGLVSFVLLFWIVFRRRTREVPYVVGIPAL